MRICERRAPPLALAVALVTLLPGCGEETPAGQRIAERIETMKQALVDENVDDFMDPVAEDFSTATLDLDRRGVIFLLRREFLARENIRARTLDLDVELPTPDRAVATFQAVVTGGSGLIPDDGEWLSFETGWRQDGGDWYLISAQWSRAGER